MKLVHIDARERFLSGLRGVTDPERKRKVIGGLFIDVFQEEAAKVADVKWLIQGTLYPDVIESSRSGSTVRGAFSPASPPTLWTLDTALGPLRETLSITSG